MKELSYNGLQTGRTGQYHGSTEHAVLGHLFIYQWTGSQCNYQRSTENIPKLEMFARDKVKTLNFTANCEVVLIEIYKWDKREAHY